MKGKFLSFMEKFITKTDGGEETTPEVKNEVIPESEPQSESLPEESPDLRDAEIASLKAEAQRLRAALANAENRREAPPSPPKGGNGGFFSPDEVKKMSASEVRENMTAIRQSMEKWK